MNLAVLEAHEGHLDAALQNAEQAVRLRPDHPRTHYYLGDVLERMGRTPEALATFRQSLQLNPRDTVVQARLTRLTTSGPASLEAGIMATGLDLLYKRHDPLAAAAQFRRVLERNSDHYGANFQPAVALDEAGTPAEARPFWEKALKIAEGSNDAQTAARARARLARPDSVARPDSASDQAPTQAALMQTGLDALSAGRRDEARPFWEKVLGMAEAYNDRETAERARTRLAKGL